MNYLYYARKINVFLCSNINLIQKFDLVIMQMYLIKKYIKKLRRKYEKEL